MTKTAERGEGKRVKDFLKNLRDVLYNAETRPLEHTVLYSSEKTPKLSLHPQQILTRGQEKQPLNAARPLRAYC